MTTMTVAVRNARIGSLLALALVGVFILLSVDDCLGLFE